MSRIFLALCMKVSLLLYTEGITLDICQLARELYYRGFPRHQLEDWVCLVEKESSSRTHVIGGPNADGSYDHGLFQINDRYWCNNWDEPGKACNIRCSELRTDNIGEATKCAKKIFMIHGFDAWVAWRNYCRGHALPNLYDCGV